MLSAGAAEGPGQLTQRAADTKCNGNHWESLESKIGRIIPVSFVWLFAYLQMGQQPRRY